MLVVRVRLDVFGGGVKRSDEPRTGGVYVERAGIYGSDAVLRDDGSRRGDVFARVRRDDDEVEVLGGDARIRERVDRRLFREVGRTLVIGGYVPVVDTEILGNKLGDVLPEHAAEVVVCYHSLRHVNTRTDDLRVVHCPVLF